MVTPLIQQKISPMREKGKITSHLPERRSGALPELAPRLEVGGWKLEVGERELFDIQPPISNI
jgi:hypothetical protein